MKALIHRIASAVRHPLQTLSAARFTSTSTPPDPAIMRYVLNSARDRWQTGSMSNYTPDRIEGILRGAFSGDLVARWQLFDMMEGTWPQLAKGLAELKQSLVDCEWPLQAHAVNGAKPTEEALRRRRVVEEVLWGLDPDPSTDEGDFDDLIRDMADAWGKGISVQELDWEIRMSDAGRVVGLKAARWVHPRNYGYPPQITGMDRLMLNETAITADNPILANQLGEMVRQGLVFRNGGWVTFPKDKFLIAVSKMKSGHAIGGALLQPLAWWWCVMNFSAEWLVNLAQIFGVPMRLAYYAPTAQADQIAKIEEMLDQMGSAAWGAFPAGTLIEIKEAVKSATDNPSQAVMVAANMVCDLVILGQTLTSTQGTKGSQALGQTHADVLSDRKKALRSWAASKINRQLIPMICRLNFGNTLEMPYVLISDEDDEDQKTKAEVIQIMLKNGMQIPTAWAHDEMGIPEPADGEPVLGVLPADPLPPAGGAAAPANNPTAKPTVPAQAAHSVVQAADATDAKLAEAIAESVAGVEAKWLRHAKPFFVNLVEAARDPKIEEAEFLRIVSKVRANLDRDLLPLLDTQSLALAMERNMGAACVNGVVKAWAERSS